ncbi:MAG: hypothetical protein AAFW81_07590 [Pseudomonadota bacterium]
MTVLRWVAALFVLVAAACGQEGPPEPGDAPPPSESEAPPLDDADDSEDEAAPPPPLPSPPASLPSDWHFPPGDLLPGSNSEKEDAGVTDPSVIVPEMVFPLAEGPAFANSQIFNSGGGGYAGGQWPGPGGPENAGANFDYPWRDNFCEVRLEAKHATDLCPGGRAHKGQDLRPKTCANAVHWLVAPESGWISHVGSISVNIMGAESGMKYKFLHVQMPVPDWVETGAPVTQGQPFARVSDLLRAIPESRETTVHAHFEIHGAAEVDGLLHNGALPPYTSLVEAYLDLVADHPDQIAPTPPASSAECATPQWP